MQTSVLTLVRGRAAHLRNLIEGLAQQTIAPSELVIAWMQEEPEPDLPAAGCAVRHVTVPGEPMPLAAARNRAAELAQADGLIFLDVDCIPSPTLVASYADALDRADALFLGEVLYLPAGGVDAALDFRHLDKIGRVHPSKPPVPAKGIAPEPDTGQLWGLSFALRAERWRTLGGMDEAFFGYGGEETDFAARVKAAGVGAFWTGGARAYHQHHVVHVPPLHQFDHILRNAALFHERHGRWCMDYWLGQFRDAGLIGWSEDSPEIEVRRRPTHAEILASARTSDVLFS
ncbi:glycosyltransferase family 2 protein [Aureimonas mangrovi]|uniref:glycosyltransferase family 2 protein n=1 Tax=Aureimonas mangrovi TaxID=2758041 RepID=UPI00163D8B23|nr:galactosyltransferase-related protein [Aureimonas mangrovi]